MGMGGLCAVVEWIPAAMLVRLVCTFNHLCAFSSSPAFLGGEAS